MMHSKDVVKALKCCSKYMDSGLCEECPLFGREDCGEKCCWMQRRPLKNWSSS